MMVNLSRIDKAQELNDKGLIEIILEDETMIQFNVFSVNSRNRQHIVTYNGRTFHCTCEDYQKGHNYCYHCLGCSYFLRDLRREGQSGLKPFMYKETAPFKDLLKPLEKVSSKEKGFISPETPTGGVIVNE